MHVRLPTFKQQQAEDTTRASVKDIGVVSRDIARIFLEVNHQKIGGLRFTHAPQLSCDVFGNLDRKVNEPPIAGKIGAKLRSEHAVGRKIAMHVIEVRRSLARKLRHI